MLSVEVLMLSFVCVMAVCAVVAWRHYNKYMSMKQKIAAKLIQRVVGNYVVSVKRNRAACFIQNFFIDYIARKPAISRWGHIVRQALKVRGGRQGGWVRWWTHFGD